MTDLNERHTAFLTKGTSCSSFRPKNQWRKSVVKVLSMIDNQVLRTLPIDLGPFPQHEGSKHRRAWQRRVPTALLRAIA